MKTDIESILEDLYMIDPSLKDMEEDLRKLIEKLIEAKPSIQIDKQFVQQLRAQLMAEIPASQSNWFSKYLFTFAGGVLATGLVVALIISYMPGTQLSLPISTQEKNMVTFEMEVPTDVVAVEDMAAFSEEAPTPKMAMGAGRNEAPIEESVEQEPLFAEDDGGEAEMMFATMDAEPVFYKYTYKGEQIQLPEGSIDWQTVQNYLTNGGSKSPAPKDALIKEFEVGHPEIVVENSVTYLKFTVLPNPDSSIYPQEVLVPLEAKQ